jgi:hypothetical protein
LSVLTHLGRFTSRKDAEDVHDAWQCAHGPLAIVDSPTHVGEFTYRVVSAEALGQAPPADARQKFALIPATEFLKRPRPRWLIKGVLPEAELAAVVGEPGAGKSPFMYSMAAAIHRGAEWYGRRVRKGRAVYLVAEGSADFRSRIDAYCKEFGVDPADLPLMIDDVPNLKEPVDAAAIAHRVGKADVIFVDTFAASFLGNENSGEDIGPVLNHLKFISKHTGALCVLACHPGKDLSKGLRGWSGTLGALDTEITITKQGDFRSVEITKQKSGASGLLMNFKIKVHELGRDEDGDPVTSVTIEPHTETMKTTASQSKTRKGVYVDAIRRYVRATGQYEFDTKELAIAVAATLPKTGEKDRRLTEVSRAISHLNDDFFDVVPDTDGERVRLRGPVVDNDAWLE